MLRLVATLAVAAGAVLGAPTLVPQGEQAARAASLAAELGPFEQYTSTPETETVCLFGKAYTASYNVSLPNQDSFVRVDQAPGFQGVECSVDHTDLLISFSSSSAAQQFAGRLAGAGGGGVLLTGTQGAAECSEGFGLFRRVAEVDVGSVGAALGAPRSGYGVRVRAFKAAYDTTLQGGTVTFGANPIGHPAHAVCAARAAAPGDPATLCMGINTNDQCNGAAKSLSLFQNAYVDVTCPECFLAFDFTIGLKLKMVDFLLYDAELILTDMEVQGDLQALLQAHYNWGVNGDETVQLVQPRNLIQFWIGPLPVTIGFELPLVKTAHASFDASATAKAGAKASWTLGHYDINWDPVLGFTRHVSTPVVAYDTQVSGQAQFSGSAAFGLAPSLSVHLDDFVKTTVAFDSMVTAQVEGNTATGEVCASGSYKLSADAEAELYVSIPWTGIDKQWTWSETWFDMDGDLKQKCVSASNLSTADVKKPKQKLAGPSPHAVDARPQLAEPARPVRPAPAPFSAPSTAEVVRHVGSQPGCIGARGVRASWDASVSSEFTFINLDENRVKKLDCNAGGNKLRITFEHASDKDRVRDAAAVMTSFLTGQEVLDTLAPACQALFQKKVFLQRVLQVKDTSIPLIHSQLDIWVSQSKYDEVFNNASISLGPDADVDCSTGKPVLLRGARAAPVRGSASKHVCLGVNTNSDCSAAKAPIPLFSSEYINVDCQNCYAALNADIFFSLNITDFTVHSFEGGFRNIAVDAALITKATSSKAWNAGSNKQTDIAPPTNILSFAIGPVPIRLWFEIPLDVVSNVQAQYAASFTAGVLADAPIGDFYMQWKDGKWSAVHPTHLPKLQLTPQIGTPSAAFSASGSLKVSPAFQFHVDSVFGTTFTLNPEVDFAANASLASKKACLSSTARVSATGSAYLDINVPWALFHANGNWPQTTLFDTGTKTLEDKCISF